MGIEIKFYNLDTFKKQIEVNFIDLNSELVDLNYKVAPLIFCHFWRSMFAHCVLFNVRFKERILTSRFSFKERY